MEVGAVKQAFNNEVILLKKKLNQAKIQIIHKLTRKAKQLAEKNVPEPLKGKFNKKAEAAVNEVLIIKKIKPKDIAKFIVTHTGELNSFLNKPTVDNDKACARLLLHKVLQDKYKFIRGKFSNVPIQDLFMSRLERRKMKKEAKEKKKNKMKAKDNKVVNSEGDWDVEDVISKNKLSNAVKDDHESCDKDNDENGMSKRSDDDDDDDVSNDNVSKHNEEENNSNYDESKESEVANESDENIETANQEKSDVEDEDSSLVKQTPIANISVGKSQKQQLSIKHKAEHDSSIKPIERTKKKPERKQKDIEKNKNFNEKILQRKLKKDTAGSVAANKIVDPFFITATGENYMSVVEPRGPDEIKDEHKQGNRKLRRAAMFGHVPKIKPRQNNNNYMDDNRFSQGSNAKSKFNNRQDFNNKNAFNNTFNDRKSFNNDFNDRNSNNNNFNDRKRFSDKSNDEKSEKLHPSWEAKKKKSGILPFEGKKIVFD